MYKVIIQNINQIYFSLQDHKGKRISLTQYEMRTFKGLTLQEANSYKKFIPLGLSVLIQEDKSVIIVDDIVEVDDTILEVDDNLNKIKYTLDELQELKKAELRELCLDVGISISKKTKAELIDELVDYYGL